MFNYYIIRWDLPGNLIEKNQFFFLYIHKILIFDSIFQLKFYFQIINQSKFTFSSFIIFQLISLSSSFKYAIVIIKNHQFVYIDTTSTQKSLNVRLVIDIKTIKEILKTHIWWFWVTYDTTPSIRSGMS